MYKDFIKIRGIVGSGDPGIGRHSIRTHVNASFIVEIICRLYSEEMLDSARLVSGFLRKYFLFHGDQLL